MPELPEVSYAKKYADATVLHKEIEKLTFSEDIIFKASQEDLKKELVNREFKSTIRHGKYLLFEISNKGYLVLHLGMTGHLEYAHHGEVPKYAYFTITFKDSSTLYFICPRKLARVYLAESVEAFKKQHELGPDALAISLDDFRQIVAGRRGSIKGLLMNQKAVAGIGNLYADEVLYQSKIHPKTTPSDLNNDEIKTIFEQIGKVLDTVTKSKIKDTALPPGYLTRHRKKGADCPDCAGKVNMIKVAGRSSYFCPSCQPEKQ